MIDSLDTTPPIDATLDSLGSYATNDSLQFAVTDTVQVRAADIYGNASILATAQPPTLQSSLSLAQNAFFQGVVLVLAAIYLLLLYRHIADAKHLFGRMFHSVERLSDEPIGSGYNRFRNLTLSFGVVLLGMATVKYTDLLLPHTIDARSVVIAGWSVSAMLAWLAIGLFRVVLLRISGAITRSQELTGELLQLKKNAFAGAVLVLTPLLFLLALCPRDEGVWLSYVLIILTITLLLYYFAKTLKVFFAQKAPVLYWILYLCAVELFPISLAGVMAMRYVGR